MTTIFKEIIKGAIVGGEAALLIVSLLSYVVAYFIGILGFLCLAAIFFKQGSIIAGVILLIVTFIVWGMMLNNAENINRWFSELPSKRIFRHIDIE